MCLRTHTWRSRRNLAPLFVFTIFCIYIPNPLVKLNRYYKSYYLSKIFTVGLSVYNLFYFYKLFRLIFHTHPFTFWGKRGVNQALKSFKNIDFTENPTYKSYPAVAHKKYFNHSFYSPYS